jgi:hypothetical protein
MTKTLPGYGHPHGHDHTHDHGYTHGHHDKVRAHHHAHASANDEEMKAIEAAFIAGFRDAPDKQAFLRLSGIPLSLERPGETSLKLIEVKLTDKFQVGSASPGFATRELSYQPLPAALVGQTTMLAFVYVSVDAVEEKTFAAVSRSGDADRGGCA